MVLNAQDAFVAVDAASNVDEALSVLTDIGMYQHQREVEETTNQQIMERAVTTNTTTNNNTSLGPTNAMPKSMNIEAAKVQRFNFMVVGPSGSGKTTFCRRALERYFPDLQLESIEEGPTKTIRERGRCEKLEGNVRIIVTIVDAPGTLDSINYNDRFDPIVEYIDKQKELYFDQELYLHPLQQEHDSRIHCCFYFIMPHRFTDLDIQSMRNLQSEVALVPIVAKADTMQIPELTDHLLRIHNCINQNLIQIFDFGEKEIDTSWILTREYEEGSMRELDGPLPTAPNAVEEDLLLHQVTNDEENNSIGSGDNEESKSDDEESEDGATNDINNCDHGVGDDCTHDDNNIDGQNVLLRPQLPNVFAVISGERQYIWGKASEEDPRHSDTQRLHSLLFCEGSLGKLLAHAELVQQKWYDRYKARRENEKERMHRVEEEKKRQQRLKVMQVAATTIIFFVLSVFAFRYKVHSEEDGETMIWKLYHNWEDTDETAFMQRLIAKNESEAFLAYVSSHPSFAFARSEDGRGPMWWAMEHGNMDIARVLKDSYAVPLTDDDVNGTSPADLLMVEYEKLLESVVNLDECWFWK